MNVECLPVVEIMQNLFKRTKINLVWKTVQSI